MLPILFLKTSDIAMHFLLSSRGFTLFIMYHIWTSDCIYICEVRTPPAICFIFGRLQCESRRLLWCGQLINLCRQARSHDGGQGTWFYSDADLTATLWLWHLGSDITTHIMTSGAESSATNMTSDTSHNTGKSSGNIMVIFALHLGWSWN